MTHVIKEALSAHVEMWDKLGAPALLERFALSRGEFQRGAGFDATLKMEDRECFYNALKYSARRHKHGYLYAEGLALKPELGLLIHHAWTIDPERPHLAVDPTWRDPHTAHYAVILSFPPGEALKRMTKNGVYGLLDPGRGYDLDLLKELNPGLWGLIEHKYFPDKFTPANGAGPMVVQTG